MPATPFSFGAKGDGLTDDTAALNRWALAGGGEIPADNFCFNGPIRFNSGFKIEPWEGKLLYRRGWPAAYGLCALDWSKPTQGVRIDATAGGEIVYNGDSDMARKGLGLTYLEDFEVNNVTVVGGAAPKGINLFSAEVRNSRRGIIRGGLFSINSGQQGSDGIHFTGNCSDVTLDRVRTGSGDDSVGLTVEIPKQAGSVMERITLTNCELKNEGHSSLKVLLTSIAAGSIIRDLTLTNCTMETKMAPLGAGLPVAVLNRRRDTGARIDGVTIQGGSTTVVVPDGGLPGGIVMQFQSADRVRVLNHRIDHWTRIVVFATDCPGLIFQGGLVEPIRPVPQAGTEPLFRLDNCPGAEIDLGHVRPGWTNQPMVTRLNEAK